MPSRPPPELTLTTYRLPPTFAERVADLPEGHQAALARMVQEIGEEGVARIVRALASGGRTTDYTRRLPLLHAMAEEMLAQNPNLGSRIGGDWCKDMHVAAAKVVNSSAGIAEARSASTEAASLKKWLVREWKKYGRRLLQECRAAELARTQKELWKWAELARQIADGPFLKELRQVQSLVDKFCPHSFWAIRSR